MSRPKPVPKSPDGRTYPAHLRKYEGLDARMLPIVAELHRGTFDDIAVRIEDRAVRAQLPHWLASAQWRSLITRIRATRPWSYELGPEAPKDLSL
jgi:hypothetical protein